MRSRLVLIHRPELKKHPEKVLTPVNLLERDLAGLKINTPYIVQALEQNGLVDKDPGKWDRDDLWNFAKSVRQISKPTLIIENKMDMAYRGCGGVLADRHDCQDRTDARTLCTSHPKVWES